MANKVKGMVVLIAIMAVGAIFAPSASAFGQCGGEVSTGSQLFQAWQAMGVTSQAAKVTKSAGFHRMDGSLKHWMEERVVKANLASAASPQDFGCHPGELFSVGHRALPKGTAVMVALPLKLAKSDIRLHRCSRCKRVVISAKIVGKSTCSNPEKGTVRVGVWIVKPRHHHPHHHHKKHHKHKKPSCKQGSVVIGNGCSPQTNNAQQECEARVGYTWNSNTMVCVQVQQNAVCSAQSGVVNGNNNTVEQNVTCEGNKTEICVGTNVCNSESPPCGCEPKEPQIKITAKTELNMIPAGRTSGDFNISTYASESGGTLTVDPGIGGVSSCNSSTPEESITTSVPSGASKACVILYAPEDADKPASMTVTMTVCLGSVCETQTETVPITYPTRP